MPDRYRDLCRWAGGFVLVAALGGCGAFGPGFEGLSASSGWQPLPVGEWVVNDGITPEAVAACRAASCGQDALVASFVVGGDAARRLERNLEGGTTLAALVPEDSKPVRDGKSTTSVEPVTVGGFTGARVAIRSTARPGHDAYAVVLARREAGGRIRLILAVAKRAEAALSDAEAAAGV